MSENPRHIAMVLRLFSKSGGLELYALKLVEGLLQNGHRLTVICEVDESGLQHPQLTIHKISATGKPKSKAERLQWYLEQTSRAVAELGPFDIIHSQHFPVRPVDVVTFHNHTTRRLSRVGYGWEKLLNNAKMAFTGAYKGRDEADRQLASEAKMRIFVGQVMKDDFYQAFSLPPEAPYAVAHPGAELDEKAVGADVSCEAGRTGGSTDRNRPFTFLFVGKGFRKKGLDTLLKSCKILKARGQKFQLNIAGIRPSAVRNWQLQIMGLADCVHYLGFRHDMENVYGGADASILPSKIEPFGMAPIQGMQFDLVPIVSRICGVAEVLTDKGDALILQNHLDSAELADLMQNLIVDRDLYNKLREQARGTASKLNWRQTVAATEAAYSRLP